MHRGSKALTLRATAYKDPLAILQRHSAYSLSNTCWKVAN
jgi:hypothetical protein